MKKTFALFLGAAGALAILACLIFFVFPRKEDTSRYPRVVILGIDGIGWNFINPLFKEGKLPNLHALVTEGSTGLLQTITPTKSSVIWTSIATGKSMVKHGIVDWTFLKKNKIQVPYSQTERRAKAFWNILSDRRRSVGVINWFVSYPPEKVRGFMVTEPFRNLGRKDLAGIEITYPPDLIKSIAFAAQTRPRQILEQENLPDYNMITPDGPLTSHYRNFVAQDKAVEVGGLYLLKNFPVEVYAIYFHLPDVVSHFGALYLDPRLAEKGRKEERELGRVTPETLQEIDTGYSKILEPFYAYADRILGKYLARCSPDTTFIVCSDHSFVFQNGGYNHFDMKTIPHGVILLKGPFIKKNHTLSRAHVYDVLPTLLYMLGLPVAEDMDGKVLIEAFTDDFLRKHSLKTIRTYEDGKKRVTSRRNSKVDEKVLEDFKSLGYIK